MFWLQVGMISMDLHGLRVDSIFVGLLNKHYALLVPSTPFSRRWALVRHLQHILPDSGSEQIDCLYTLSEKLEQRLRQIQNEKKELLNDIGMPYKQLRPPGVKKGEAFQPNMRPINHRWKMLRELLLEECKCNHILRMVNVSKPIFALVHPWQTFKRWRAGALKK